MIELFYSSDNLMYHFIIAVANKLSNKAGRESGQVVQ